MKNIKFNLWDVERQKMYNDALWLRSDMIKILSFLEMKTSNKCEWLSYTGFKDCNKKELYDGDIIGEWCEIAGEMIQSKLTIFWNDKKGQWHLDQSHHQDRSHSTPLHLELSEYRYEKLGNKYQNPELLKRD